MGVQIPVGWGTFRCKCNLVDYLDFNAAAQQAAGAKGGGSTTTGYSYSATIILGICEGPIDGVTTVYVDSNVYVYNSPYSLQPNTGVGTALAQAGLSLNTGAIGQAVWSYLTSAHPDHAIGYSGLAIAYAANYALDSSASTPNHSFEVVRTAYTVVPAGGGAAVAVGVSGTPDCDPSLMLTDFFQNTRTGVPSWGTGLLSSSAMTQYQDYCLAAGLLLSPVIDSERSASDFMNEVLMATNSTCVWSEGVLKMIPYGDTALSGNGKTYTPNITPVYALNDDSYVVDKPGDPPLQVDIMDQSDAYNVVQMEFLDRTNQYNMAIALASDAANVAQYGMRRKDPDTVHVICTPAVAAIAGQLWLQRTLYVRAQYKFKLDWPFAILEPGDIVELTDAALGLNAYPVRIIQIDEDEKYGLQITAEDSQIGVANAPLYTMQAGLGTTVNKSIDPGGVEANLLIYSGDAGSAAFTPLNATITSNSTTDQFGLSTAALLSPTNTGSSLGTPAQLGTASAASGGVDTLAITTGPNSAAGNLLVLLAAHGTAAETISSVADSASNTYAAGTQVSSGNFAIRPFYSAASALLLAGGTITTTFSSNDQQYAAAISIPGVLASSPLDKQAAGTASSGTSPSIATGTLAQANEVVIGFIIVEAGAADTFTEASGFTTGGSIALASNSILRWAWKETTATTTVTYAPTLGTSRSYIANVLSFKAASATSVHAVSQGIAAFAGLAYTFAVCLQKDVHKNWRVALQDGAGAVGAYLEVDTNAGAILTPGTAFGGATVISASLNTTLVNGIWQAVITAQLPGVTEIYASVYMLSDAGALNWTGDTSNGGYVSQFALRQGVSAGVYAQSMGFPAGPQIFNPPSVVTQGGMETWCAVAGGDDWAGAFPWISLDGGDSYQQLSNAAGFVTATAARFGILTASYALGSDPDTSDTLAVDLGASDGILTTAADAVADASGTLCLIDSELVSFSTATLTNPNRYNLTTYVRRGVLTTTIASHIAGSKFVRLDNSCVQLPVLSTQLGVPAYVKFQSFNNWGWTQDLANCVAYPFTPATVAAGGNGAGATINGFQLAATYNIFYVSTTDPNLTEPVQNNSAWFNPSTAALYIRQGGAWVLINAPASGDQLYTNDTPGTWTFTFPALADNYAYLYAWGAGGGGGALGGYSGAYSEKHIAVTPGITVLSGTIGAGGLGAYVTTDGLGDYISYDATDGTETTITCASPTVSMTAHGGPGGDTGGGGATASGGDTNTTGNVASTAAGKGAPNGGGDTLTPIGSSIYDGTMPGGGGGGAIGSTSGGVGASGMVKIVTSSS